MIIQEVPAHELSEQRDYIRNVFSITLKNCVCDFPDVVLFQSYGLFCRKERSHWQYQTLGGCKKKTKKPHLESWETFCILTPLLFVLKCKSCLKHFCSKCQRQENENIVKSGTCDQCDIKVLRTLQEICRSNIRRTIKGAIGAAGSSADMLQSGDIDQSVQHLPLPGPVKNYVCYKWDLPSPNLPRNEREKGTKNYLTRYTFVITEKAKCLSSSDILSG